MTTRAPDKFVRVDAATYDKIKAEAVRRGVTMKDMMSVISQMAVDEDRFLRQVGAGIRELDAGKGIHHKEAKRRFAKCLHGAPRSRISR